MSRLRRNDSSLGKSTWSNTFPDDFETLTDSEKFMERCLLLGTSQVLQSRKLLPENIFKKRSISDICRCWVPDTKCLTGGRVVEKIKGAAEAMRQGYLQEFIIVVSTNEDDYNDAIEVFSWSVDYSNGQAISTFSAGIGQALAKLEYLGPEGVKTQTVDLLLRIRKLCRQVLQPLPEGAFPTFRITYSNRAPKGYQAPGFYRSPELYDLDPKARSMIISGTATAQHKMLLSVSSVCLDDEFAGAVAMNASFISNETLDTSFGTVNNLYDSILENPQNTPKITFGERIPGKKRGQRGGKAETFAANKKSKKEAEVAREISPTESIREITPTEPLQFMNLNAQTPGKSFKLDQVSPGK